jgi:dTDP-4-dehydrorhamnose reductase
MKKVLLLGSRGYLGSYLVKYAPKDITLIVSARDKEHYIGKFEFLELDITNREQVIKEIAKLKPYVVINAAANALPDLAEEKKEWTYSVNVTGVSNIIEGCKKSNSKLIHISTDYVFSGEKGNYTEEDVTKPVNYYGETKLEAEKLVKSSGLKYLICRTSVLYGLKLDYQRRVLFYEVYDKLKENKDVIVQETQIASPTLVDDLALCIYKMLDFEKSGIYHTSSSNPVSRYEYAIKLAEIFNLDKKLIKPVQMVKKTAVRPLNTSLNTSKVQKDFKVKFRTIEDGLKFIKEQIVL